MVRAWLGKPAVPEERGRLAIEASPATLPWPNGRRLGTLNFCGEEGMYGEREMGIGRVLSGLLVPAMLKAVDG